MLTSVQKIGASTLAFALIFSAAAYFIPPEVSAHAVVRIHPENRGDESLPAQLIRLDGFARRMAKKRDVDVEIVSRFDEQFRRTNTADLAILGASREDVEKILNRTIDRSKRLQGFEGAEFEPSPTRTSKASVSLFATGGALLGLLLGVAIFGRAPAADFVAADSFSRAVLASAEALRKYLLFLPLFALFCGLLAGWFPSAVSARTVIWPAPPLDERQTLRVLSAKSEIEREQPGISFVIREPHDFSRVRVRSGFFEIIAEGSSEEEAKENAKKAVGVVKAYCDRYAKDKAAEIIVDPHVVKEPKLRRFSQGAGLGLGFSAFFFCAFVLLRAKREAARAS